MSLPLEQRLTEVRPVPDKRADDLAAHGRVPAVVRQRRQEGLVDGGAVELAGQGVVAQHVEDAVRLPLDPEPVAELGAPRHVVRARLAGVGDHVVVVGCGDGAYALVEMAGEEVCGSHYVRGCCSVLWARVFRVRLLG